VTRNRTVRTYRAFGLAVASGVPLPGLPEATSPVADLILRSRPRRVGRDRLRAPRRVRLPDGRVAFTVARLGTRSLVRFGRLADFLVSRDGREIGCASRRRGSARVVAHLFLAQVIPLALSRQGRLVLHASAVQTPVGAVAFLGPAGSGKSTLGASFVREAFPLLADDGLLLTEVHGTPAGVPSYPEIRLWPDACAALSSEGLPTGLGHPRGKRSIQAGQARWPFGDGPVPVRRLYVLGEPAAGPGSEAVTIEPLTKREAFLELVRHSFRLDFDDRARLRKEFDRIAGIAAAVGLYRLSFARDWSRLAAVRRAVLQHLAAA
jgi:hypothetical protein